MGVLVSIGYTLITLGCFAGLRFLRWPGPLALAAALLVCLADASATWQLALLTGLPGLGWGLWGLTLLLSLGLVVWRRTALRRDAGRVRAVLGRAPGASAVIGIALGYALLQVLFLYPETHDVLAYHLPRIALFLQAGTVFPETAPSWHSLIFPIGSDALLTPYVLLEARSGFAFPSWQACLAVAAAGCALADALGASRRAGLWSVALVLTLPLVFYQGAIAKNDLMGGAIFLLALVLVLRGPGRWPPYGLVVLAVLLAFGPSVKTTVLAVLPGLALYALIRGRQVPALAGWRIWRARLATDGPLVLWLLPVLVLVSPVWWWAGVAQVTGSWSGPASFTERHRNHDGLAGAAANASRYAVQLVHVGELTNRMTEELTGLRPDWALTRTWHATAGTVFGRAGNEREPFGVRWINHPDFTGFGPAGTLLVFGCLPWAMLRRREAALACVPAGVYLGLVCLQLSWMPWNLRFLTPFMLGLLPVLPPVVDRLLVGSRAGVIPALLAGLSLTGAVLFAKARPVIPLGQGDAPLAAPWVHRFAHGDSWALPRRAFEPVIAAVPTGEVLAVASLRNPPVWLFMERRRDLTWDFLGVHRGDRGGRIPAEEQRDRFLAGDGRWLLVIDAAPDHPALTVVTRAFDGQVTLYRRADQEPGKS
ncbi:MAG: hypothetical protein ACFE0O_15305 [Opitutales bacterium]